MSKSIITAGLAVALAAFVGCEGGVGGGGGEPAGGPGADVRGDEDSKPQDEAKTFTPSLESESVEIAAGSQKEVVLTIERGEQFDQTVVAEVTAPEGVTVEPETIEYQAGQKEGTITVQTGSDAGVGQELSIEIQFKPESGQSLTKQLKVVVTEPENSGETKTDSQPQPEEPEQPDETEPQPE